MTEARPRSGEDPGRGAGAKAPTPAATRGSKRRGRAEADLEALGFDPELDVVLDTRSLRALAHPIRLRLRSELVAHGPATATQLAARIGESSGATSYHLRQLAAFGVVVDEPGRGRGRERYWRALYRSTWSTGPGRNPQQQAASAEYIRAVARWYADCLMRFADGVEATETELGKEWVSAWNISDWLLDLSPAEATELARRFHELCLPYRHEGDEPVTGKRRVVVQFQIMPTVGGIS